MIRQNIIVLAKISGQKLTGKTFLNVYEEEYFEVSVPVYHFLHLICNGNKCFCKGFLYGGLGGTIMNNWTNNLIQYVKDKTPGTCPICGSTDVEVEEHVYGRKSISFKCKTCGKGDHFDGCFVNEPRVLCI